MQINNQQPDPAARNRGKLVQACNLRLEFSFRLIKPNGMDTACNELPRIQEEYTAVTNQKAAPRSNDFQWKLDSLTNSNHWVLSSRRFLETHLEALQYLRINKCDRWSITDRFLGPLALLFLLLYLCRVWWSVVNCLKGVSRQGRQNWIRENQVYLVRWISELFYCCTNFEWLSPEVFKCDESGP